MAEIRSTRSDLNTQEVTTLLEHRLIQQYQISNGISSNINRSQDPCVEFGCDDIGENDVILVNTDQSGNASNCSSTVTVVDSIAPSNLAKISRFSWMKMEKQQLQQRM